jgi:ankyrin repeat protein
MLTYAGETAMHWAAKKGHNDLVKLLLRHHANAKAEVTFLIKLPI